MDADLHAIRDFVECYRASIRSAERRAARELGLRLSSPGFTARMAEAVELLLGPPEPGSVQVRRLLGRLHAGDLLLACAADDGDLRARALLAERRAGAHAEEALRAYRGTVSLERWLACLAANAALESPPAPDPPPAEPARSRGPFVPLTPRLEVALALVAVARVPMPVAARTVGLSTAAVARAASKVDPVPLLHRLAAPPPSACPDANLVLAWLDRLPMPADAAVATHVASCLSCLGLVRAAGPPSGTRRTPARVAATLALLVAAGLIVLAVATRPGQLQEAQPSRPVPTATALAPGATAQADSEPTPVAVRLPSPVPREPVLLDPSGVRSARRAEPSPGPPHVEPAPSSPSSLSLQTSPTSPLATPAPASVPATLIALRRAPGSSRAARLLNQAIARHRRGTEASTLNLIARALLLEPTLKEGHFDAAVIAESMGDHRRARAHWQRFIELGASKSDEELVRARLSP